MSVEQMFHLGSLAQAAYADLQGAVSDAAIRDALNSRRGGFTATQARQFAERYSVVTQYDDDAAGTSLSATAFRDQQGQLTVAIRGTLEAAGDLFPTDAMIGTHGVGYDQVAALHNWWQRSTNPAGTQVAQYRVVERADSQQQPGSLRLYGLPNLADSRSVFLEAAQPVSATGELLPHLAQDANAKVHVTGHSLGGHLAMAFAAMFPGAAESVTTFNAPGFTATSVNQAFFARLGGTVPTPSSIGSITTNVVANHTTRSEVPWQGIAILHSRPGTPVDIPIERQALTGGTEPDPPDARNHSQGILVDSLAVYRTVEQLMSGLSTTDFNKAIAGAANREHEGLEGLASGPGRLFGISTPSFTNGSLPTGNANREAMYEVLSLVRGTAQQSPAFSALTSKLTFAPTHAATANTLRNDFAAFLGVELGLPFGLTLTDPSPTSPASLALYGAHRTLYERWAADSALSPEQRRQADARGALNYSDAYLQDKSAFANRRIQANIQDLEAFGGRTLINAPAGTKAIEFEDLGSAQTIRVAAPGQSGLTPATRVVLGSDADNPNLNGAELEDRLYGGGGTDQLDGKAAKSRKPCPASTRLARQKTARRRVNAGCGVSQSGDRQLKGSWLVRNKADGGRV